jgi:hypothetical protein
MTATLHDLVRFYRNGGLVGEDKAALTALVALAGDASVVIRGYPGTGKTQAADISIGLLPAEIVCRVDMISKLGIWSKGMVERVAKARIIYFPEQQNAGDNDEVAKVLKKWGDGKDAEREKSADYGNDTDLATLPCRTFISTAAITNEAHDKSFDLESARRVVKVNTNPSEDATGRVLASKADALVKGKENVRVMSALDVARVKKHVAAVMTVQHDAVQRVRFFGAHKLLAAVPKTFPEARSAFALFEKVLLGIARFHSETEVRVGDEIFLSPQRVAEVWSFYGDIIVENALKFDTSDREILSAFPQPVWNGEAPAPDCCMDLQTVMRKLKPYGLTDPALIKRQIGRLEMKGFLAQAEGFRTTRWHRTGLADVANFCDWPAIIDACVEGAKTYLDGKARDDYLAKCDEARGARAMTNPITGDAGPIVGEKSVLYADTATGGYAPVGVQPAAVAKGIFAFNQGDKK